jgi:hypothetical protein
MTATSSAEDISVSVDIVAYVCVTILSVSNFFLGRFSASMVALEDPGLSHTPPANHSDSVREATLLIEDFAQCHCDTTSIFKKTTIDLLHI